MPTSGKLTASAGFELTDQKEADSSEFSRGFIFYSYNDPRFLPQRNENRKTWIKGFCFAIDNPIPACAGTNIENSGKTIQEALIDCGVTVMQLVELLQVADELAESREEKWWPQIPVR